MRTDAACNAGCDSLQIEDKGSFDNEEPFRNCLLGEVARVRAMSAKPAALFVAWTAQVDVPRRCRSKNAVRASSLSAGSCRRRGSEGQARDA